MTRNYAKLVQNAAQQRDTVTHTTIGLRQLDIVIKIVGEYVTQRENIKILHWVEEALKQGASLAHKWAKGIPPQVPTVGANYGNPIQLLNHKREEWEPRWSRDRAQAATIQRLFSEIKTEALLELPKILTVEQLNDHLGKCRASRATGIDGLTNQDLRNSPPGARPKLCEIINRILTTLTVPMQWQVNVIQLLPKPKEVIDLLPSRQQRTPS